MIAARLQPSRVWRIGEVVSHEVHILEVGCSIHSSATITLILGGSLIQNTQYGIDGFIPHRQVQLHVGYSVVGDLSA